MEKPKKEGVHNFVGTMLESAQKKQEVKPQTRYADVDANEISKIMDNIKRGKLRQ